MLKYYNYDIVFQEIPDEVTLAVNITNCPNQCPKCHSKFLWEDIGEPFNENSASAIIETYKDALTCISFMGGDNEPEEVNRLAAWLKTAYPKLKVAWYSGKQELAPCIQWKNFDYIKVGPYKDECGSLKKKTTNQKLFKKMPDGHVKDITFRFWKQ